MKILKAALSIIRETHYVGEHDVIELFFGLQTACYPITFPLVTS